MTPTEARKTLAQVPYVRVASVENGVMTVHVEGADDSASAMLNKALGSDQEKFANGLLMQLVDLADSGGHVNQATLDFALSAVAGVRPTDEAESMLAAQMAAVHLATMRAAHSLAIAVTPQRIELAERTFNKLARTYTTQLEALKRYRSTGNQRIAVQHQHVTVEDGAQAVVASSISQARGKSAGNAD